MEIESETINLSTSSTSIGKIEGWHYSQIDISIEWTGNPTGSFKIQTQIDDMPWDDHEIEGVDAVGTSDSHTFHFNIVAAAKFRLVYSSISGSGYCYLTASGVHV